MMNRLEEWQ